jgi:hypothetical protein
MESCWPRSNIETGDGFNPSDDKEQEDEEELAESDHLYRHVSSRQLVPIVQNFTR